MEASSLLNDATSSPPPPSLGSLKSTIQLNDNQEATITAAGGENVDGSSTQQSMTISKDEDDKSSPRVSSQVDDPLIKPDNHQDSSIKLKRCKHGRIIIKDLSKKKLAQQSDNGGTTTANKQGNESNNNHIISGSTPTNDNGAENESNQSFNMEQLDPQCAGLNHNSSKLKPTHSQLRHQPCTPPTKPAEQSPDVKSVDQISPSQITDKRGSSRRLVLRARARSQSSNESLSPPPLPPQIVKSTRSPPRRSRYSRSPRRERSSRSSSRDRARRQSSRRRNNSPSPRRRDRSSSSRRKRRGRGRSSSRRRHKTPDRHRRSDIQRNHKDSPTSRSPNHKLPRSRSITPPRARSTSRRRNRRNSSRSVSREPSRYERYSHTNHERSREQYDKAANLRSPVDHRLHADALDSAAVESYISINQNNHENQLVTKLNVAEPSTKSSLAQAVATQPPSPQKFSPEQAQVTETSPGASPLAPSPATPPSNDDSTSSDIYDPEAPIIPISPCDSPPMSPMTNVEPSKPKLHGANNEKNGEDDVPSSAVQLNQQEKYLQKLNRQERVIEEVKVALRPFYQNRSIDKEQYKDVLRRAVPKICHSKNGEINPIKIRALVDAYVKKMKRH